MKKIRMFTFLKGNFLVLDVPAYIKILKIIYFYYLVFIGSSDLLFQRYTND